MSRAALLAVVLAVGPTPVAPDGDAPAVIALELKLWEAWKAHDLATIRALSTPDYRSVSEEGPEKAVGLADITREFGKYRLDAYTLGKMAAFQLAPDVILLTYNAKMQGSFAGKDISRPVAEGSIWVRRHGRWLNAFLHEVTASLPR